MVYLPSFRRVRSLPPPPCICLYLLVPEVVGMNRPTSYGTDQVSIILKVRSQAVGDCAQENGRTSAFAF